MLFLLFLLVFATAHSSIDISNKSFVFISGWPQSGTSFLHQILSMTPLVSTMVKKCNDLIGAKCLNWNHEGQWLLTASTNNDMYFNPGSMCRPQAEMPKDSPFRDSVIGQWSRLWDSNSSIFVEKSPQSMLKMDLLRKIFSGSRDVKFLVVIKHPATLNTACPRDRKWLTHKDKITQEQRNSEREIFENLQYFKDFLMSDNSANGRSSSGRNCSIGWLPAMRYLRNYLHSETRSLADTRIIRYEDFESPHKVCKSLLHFIFTSFGNENNPENSDPNSKPPENIYYTQAIRAVCDVYFHTHNVASTSSSNQSPSPRYNRHPPNTRVGRYEQMQEEMRKKLMKEKRRLMRNESDGSAYESLKEAQLLSSPSPPTTSTTTTTAFTSVIDFQRRQLRLKDGSEVPGKAKGFITPGIDLVSSAAFSTNFTSTSSSNSGEKLVFQPILVKNARVKRFLDFRQAVEMQSTRMKVDIENIDAEMNEFGYGLKTFDIFKRHKTVFDQWDLMKQQK